VWPRPAQGTSVGIEGAGVHWITYFSADTVGNVETARWRSVTVAARARSVVRYRR
jgi:hypothetical protein